MDTNNLARLGEIRLKQVMKRLMRRRVRRGVQWLNENAPIGWQWNLFNIGGNGNLYYRGHDFQDNECALALAFMHRADLASSDFGYVTYASVKRALKLEDSFLLSHGFRAELLDTEGSRLLDDAWKAALLSYAQPDSIPIKHSTSLQRGYLGSLEDPTPNPSWWKRAWDRLCKEDSSWSQRESTRMFPQFRYLFSSRPD